MKTIYEILNIMADNTYLVPTLCWSSLSPMSNTDFLYQMYSNERRDYLVFKLKNNDLTELLDFTCNLLEGTWEIILKLEFSKPISQIKKDRELIESFFQELYSEVFSLNADKTKLKEIRKKINEQIQIKLKAEKEIENLKKQLEDSKRLTK